eukprot:TRINITY_DN35440_c0_g1_i1.p1 TRINITY_DN35440_c0_g1~~TRINITY_DN35440_c0_g1_i1.p1  ORF type:complete len:281 (-),score=49.86 TRINITY_DN35440_c0_g1_i1:501-1343(-)
MAAVSYSSYQRLRVAVQDDGIAVVTITSPAKLNAIDGVAHHEAANVWYDLGRDPRVRVVILTGEGKAFSAGGDMKMIDEALRDHEYVMKMYEEARSLVLNMLRFEKVIISAINGVAVGAGLALALMADISIASDSAQFSDGHIRLGVAAGDHAVMLWPLLCGMAKAKYYILTGRFVSAREAERIGLVSKCVPADELMQEAMDIARSISNGPQYALKFTKRSLNAWLTQNGSNAFDLSCALEMLNFGGADVREGKAALEEKRRPSFPSVLSHGEQPRRSKL